MPSGSSDQAKRISLKGRGIALNLALQNWNGSGSTGTLHERFEPLGHLGEGGMGRVWVARDRRLARTVALKFLSPELAGHPTLVQRFLTEAQVAAQLEHPNIVPVYGLEHGEDGQPAFVMQLVEGETLAMLLQHWATSTTRRALEQSGDNLKQRLSRLLPVCDAIQYANDRHVVHRDLKPSNILVGPHGEVLVTDWGLARVTPDPNVEAEVRQAVRQLARSTKELHALDTTRFSPSATPDSLGPSLPPRNVELPLDISQPLASSERATRHGQALGTIEYMSPEQWHDAASVTAAADQFSLALIAYELTTLRHARDHNQPEPLLINAVREGSVQPFVDIWDNPVDSRLSAILKRALATSPEDRYPSVQAFAIDLNHYIRGEALDVLPDGPVRRVTRRMVDHPVVTTLVVLGGLLLLSVFTLFSVWSAERRAQRATRETANLTRLTSEITHRTHALELRMVLTEGELQSFAVAAIEHVILDAQPGEAAELNERGATGSTARAGFKLESEIRAPVPRLPFVATVPTKHDPDAGETLERMLELSPLAETLLTERSGAEQTALECDGLFMALDVGAYVEMPTYATLPTEYDPRLLEWYLSVKRAKRQIWQTFSLASEPEHHELGLLMPLFLETNVIGVLGALVPYEQLTAHLRLPGEPDLVCASILDASGAKIVSRRFATFEEACEVPQELHAAIENRQAYGRVEQAGRLWLFDRLDTIGWYYVAEFPRTVLTQDRIR